MAKKQYVSKVVTSPEILQKLGQDLKRRRTDLKISVREAASLAGTSPGSIARIEAGDEGVAFGLFLG
ncbi:MAG: helix-turn-helix domain-containing protein, partial [Oligoflexus sp.]|nr:helix-turn-helix domain-containing protein [Oligoflexus sp.]